MKFWLPLILIYFFSVSSYAQKTDNSTLTTLYFIRHAEKDRSNPENKNPHLTAIGNERAIYWSEVLKNVTFDAVYSTDYNRTIETATPTAQINNLTVKRYNVNTLDAAKLITENTGNNVLIVGHSDTTPKFVNNFLGSEKYQPIADNNNGNLYILTISDDRITDLLLEIHP